MAAGMRVSPKGVASSVEVPDKIVMAGYVPAMIFLTEQARPNRKPTSGSMNPPLSARAKDINVGVISTCRFCTNLTDLREAGRRPLFALIVAVGVGV